VWDIPKDVVEEQSDEALLKLVRDRLANPAAFLERIEYLCDHPNEQSRETIELADGRWLDRYSAPVIGDEGTHFGRLWSFRDITDRIEREQMLKQQRDELIELQRVNALVRQSIQALQDTATRTEIETAVCEALTESEIYQAAWIGDWAWSAAGDRIVHPQTAAGVSESYLEGISQQESGPAATALHTGKVQVINDITTATKFPDERRETALAHDHQTLAAVPVTKTDTVYGVLVVYAPPNHTICETEREILADLGQSIALAIQRVQSQRSLTAETVVSLDLRIPAAKFVFAEVSAELDCELSLEQRIAESGGVTIYYLTVQGVTAERVCERLEADSLIAACTVVGGGESTHSELVEARLTNDHQLPLDVLTDYGATVASARAVDGDITLRVELPLQSEVRNVLSAVREVAPSIELVSKRHVDRPIKTAAAMQDRVISQLTEKQENALKSAYARGYYAWPRDSTMEEIAETFDVSAPTLHYRLRNAHNTVIGSLLDPQQVPDRSALQALLPCLSTELRW
jgi:predicted DNA binding protein